MRARARQPQQDCQKLQGKTGLLWWQNTSEIEDPSALRRNSMTSALKSYRHFSKSWLLDLLFQKQVIILALPLSEMQLVESQWPGLNNTDHSIKHPSVENNVIPCFLRHQCCEAHVQWFLFMSSQRAHIIQRFCFHFKRAETDHRGRAGRIFPATCHSALAGTAVREQSSVGPCSFRK